MAREHEAGYNNALKQRYNWWVRGYRACGQQYELRLPPDWLIRERYDLLVANGRIEIAENYGMPSHGEMISEDEIEDRLKSMESYLRNLHGH